MTLRRCKHQMIFDVLEDAKLRRRAPTRLAGGCGVNYNFVQHMIEAGLLKKVQIQRRRRVVRTFVVPSEKGKAFLEHFEALQTLMPKEGPS